MLNPPLPLSLLQNVKKKNRETLMVACGNITDKFLLLICISLNGLIQRRIMSASAWRWVQLKEYCKWWTAERAVDSVGHGHILYSNMWRERIKSLSSFNVSHLVYFCLFRAAVFSEFLLVWMVRAGKGLVEDWKASSPFLIHFIFLCRSCYVNKRPWLSLRPEFSSRFLAFTKSLLILVL